MKYRELEDQLRKFRDGLTEHRDLYSKSLDASIPDYPIRNGEKLNKQEVALTRQLYLLEPFLQRLAKQRIRLHRATGMSWDIFKVAVGNDAAIIKGSSLNDAIRELEGVLAVVENEPGDAEIPTAKAEVPAPVPRSTTTGDIHISGGNVTIAGGTINVNEINLADFIRASIPLVDEKAGSPEQASKVKNLLSRMIDGPLGRVLTQIVVGEVLKHV
jgi:hypothetical protein